jgi:hypothetical protein
MKNKTKLIRFELHFASYSLDEVENRRCESRPIFINPAYVISVLPIAIPSGQPYRSSAIVSEIVTTNGFWRVDCDVQTVIDCLSV